MFASSENFVVTHGSMSSDASSISDIRRQFIENDLVDCMIVLPGSLCYTTQISLRLKFMASDKKTALFATVEAKRMPNARHEKMKMLYKSLSGPKFRDRVETIFKAFVTQREGLEAKTRFANSASGVSLNRLSNRNIGVCHTTSLPNRCLKENDPATAARVVGEVALRS